MRPLAVITQPGGITIAEDTAAYHHADGRFLGEASGVVALAHIRMLIAAVGPAGFAHQLVARFAADMRGFDMVVQNASSWLRTMCAGSSAHVTLVGAGFSVAAGRFAAFRVSSRDRLAADRCGGSEDVVTIPAWTLRQMNRVWCSEAPEETYFEWLMDTASGSTEIAARLVVAAREYGVSADERAAGTASRIVITSLGADDVRCRVLQRFDPAEGVPIGREGRPLTHAALRPEIL